MDTASSSSLSSPPQSLPSSPLSMASRSPSPPPGYPSPSLTQLSTSRSLSNSPDAPEAKEDGCGPPPAKKRKISSPKERTTEYLDLNDIGRLTNAESDPDSEIQLQRLLKALRTKRKIVVIAGAGISVSAGIPDFRSSTGLFTTLRSQHKLKASGKHLFDASVYRTDSSTSSFHEMVRELSHMTRQAKPTAFHHMVATLAEEGRLLRLYSQNVDGIDTSLEPLRTNIPLNPKGPWPKTIQLHGGLEKMVCTKCGDLSNFDGALFEGPAPPSCKQCEEHDQVRTMMAGKRSHGIGRLRPRMVLYNEFNPDEDAIGAVSSADLRTRPDAVIVVGTSLKVPGVRRIAREMCAVTRGRRDGFTAWINQAPEPVGNDVKECWDLVVKGDCDEVARQVNIPQWDDKDYNSLGPVTKEALENLQKGSVSVVVESKEPMSVEKQGMPTPIATPQRQSPTPFSLKLKLKQPQFGSKDKTVGKKDATLPGRASKTIVKAAAKKKPSRKPAASTKATNKITLSFGVTKQAKSSDTKSTKAEKPAHDFSMDKSRTPNTPPKTQPDPMRPISPSEVRNNSDASLKGHKDDKDNKMMSLPTSSSSVRPYLEIKLPESPVSSQLESQQHRETISPKGSLPNGMAHLLDSD